MVSSSSLVMNTDRRARKFHFAGKKVNWKEFNPGLAGTPANPGLHLLLQTGSAIVAWGVRIPAKFDKTQ